MGVPKRRTAPSAQGTRRSHHKAGLPSIVRDPRTGRWKLNHGPSATERDRKGRPLGDPAAPR